MLDASTRIDVLNLLGDLKERGLGILFITHDLSLGNYISDRTLILRRGRIVELGPTTKVFGDPRHSYTRALLACVPQLHRRWSDEAGGGGGDRERRPACGVGEWRRPRRRRRRPLRRAGGGRGVSRIALQLYTVRDAAATDLARTLGRAAELGFEGVELHDLHGHEPGEVRAMLDDARPRRLRKARRPRDGRGRPRRACRGARDARHRQVDSRLDRAAAHARRGGCRRRAARARGGARLRSGPAARLPQPRRRGCGAVRRAERPRSPSRRRRRAVPRARPGLGVVRRRRPDRAARRRPGPRAARARQGHAPRRRAGARSTRGR